ncbi:efflux RND transporter permease subunit, partial [Oligoflexaceae bacterium]|nr:efflux RND transporter permease subunit [Oligoflexaceae bacterium]
MNRIFEIFIDRWRIPFSVTVIGVIGGVFGLKMMKLETYPPVNIGTTIIATSYPGATAGEVNEDVTQKIEDQLREVNGFKDVTSVSQTNLSRIIIRTDIDRYDAEDVLEDIQEAVARVSTLPDGVSGRPVITEIKSSEFPVYRVLLVAPKRGREHDLWADRLKDEFERVSEVARVQLGGFSEREFHILLNPKRMDRLHISIQEVVSAIRGRLRDIPAGDITIDNKTKLVRLTGEEYDMKQLEKIVVRSIAGGQVLKLKDIARIVDRFRDKDTIVSFEGRDAISVVVTKKEKSDTLETIGKLEPIEQQFRERLPKGYELIPYDNEAVRVDNILSIVVGNAMLGFVIVAVLLLIFFPSVLGIMTALSLPIVVMLTLAIMPFIGADFNRITLLAIIICLGLLVDNSIVVSENYVSLRQRGLGQSAAAKRAVQQFWLPLTATVLTTIAAFAPMLVTKGVMGDFIKYIPIVVTLALLISLLESFVLLPSRLRFTYRKIKREGVQEDIGRDTSWFGPVQSMFEGFILICLKMRYLTLLLLLGLFASAIYVQVNWNYFDVFPKNDVEVYTGQFEASVGTPLDSTRAMADRLMLSVRKEMTDRYGDGVIKLQIATIGDNGESPSDSKAKFGDHLGSI